MYICAHARTSTHARTELYHGICFGAVKTEGACTSMAAEVREHILVRGHIFFNTVYTCTSMAANVSPW